MATDLSRDGERQGTRKLMMMGAFLGVLLIVGLTAWFAISYKHGTTDFLGRPLTGADKRTAVTTVGTGAPSQGEAQSAVAKNDPAGNEDATGGRARNIKQSSQPVSLTQDNRDKLRSIFGSSGATTEKANFEMMIGTSVPRQTKLADLPPKATQVLSGYWGDQYMIAGKDLIIVDQHSHRVAAIIRVLD